jgi:hypothetical protein
MKEKKRIFEQFKSDVKIFIQDNVCILKQTKGIANLAFVRYGYGSSRGLRGENERTNVLVAGLPRSGASPVDSSILAVGWLLWSSSIARVVCPPTQ